MGSKRFEATRNVLNLAQIDGWANSPLLVRPIAYLSTPAVFQAGVATTAGQIPWELTPVLGLMTDSIPLFGFHRRSWLALVGGVGESRHTEKLWRVQ